MTLTARMTPSTPYSFSSNLPISPHILASRPTYSARQLHQVPGSCCRQRRATVQYKLQYALCRCHKRSCLLPTQLSTTFWQRATEWWLRSCCYLLLCPLRRPPGSLTPDRPPQSAVLARMSPQEEEEGSGSLLPHQGHHPPPAAEAERRRSCSSLVGATAAAL